MNRLRWCLRLLAWCVVCLSCRAVAVEVSMAFRPETFFLTQFSLGGPGAPSYTVVHGQGFYPAPVPDGMPQLLAKPVSVLLPAGTDYDGFTIKRVVEVPWADQQLLLPAQPAITPEYLPPGDFIPGDPAVYGFNGVFPAAPVEYTGTAILRGRRVAQFLVYPVRYLPVMGRLLVIGSLEFTVRTKPLPPATAPGTMTPLFAGLINECVINPDPALRGQAVAPALDGVIIAPAALVDAYQAMADYRALADGLVLEVVDYAVAIAGQAGADGAEKLRNYLSERLQWDGINYVILGTDAPGIPVRYVNEPMAHDIDSLDRWPAELYYGMLENGWQPAVTPRPPMVPSVIVGRLPLRTPEQVYGYLGKVMKYEGGAWQVIKGKYLLTGVRCFYDTGEMTGKARPADVFNDGLPQPREHATVTDGEVWSRRLFRDAPMLGNPPTEVKGLFDSVSSWDRVPGDYPITPERMLEKGNLGWEFLINATHGHFFGFMLRVKWGSDSPPPTFFSIDEAARMQHIFAVVTAVSCMSGGFDHEPDPCLSEALLRNPDGGALVYHGCSRLGLADSFDLYSGDSGWNILEFHQRITQGGFPGKTLGAAYVEQKINLAPLAAGGHPGKYDFFTLQYAVHYQGDPTLRCLPRPVTVGSKLSVAAGDVAGPGASFAAAPRLAATGVELPETRGILSGLSKIRNGRDVRSGARAYAADFQWNSRVKLWDEAGTLASRRAGADAGSSLARLSGCDFQLWLTGLTAVNQRLVAADAGLARLLRPVLWNISYTGKLARGTVLTVRGSFFGSARPVVYLEGRDATGAIRWLPCAVQAWYPFAAANGRPFASVMEPMTGESWLHCAYPAVPAGTVPTGWLILKNAVGIDAFPFPAAKPSSP